MTDSGMTAHYQDKPPPRLVSCVPAYGRDYETAEQVKADWEASKDFRVQDLLAHGYVNKDDKPGNVVLKLRYNRLQDFVLVNEDGTFSEEFESGK